MKRNFLYVLLSFFLFTLLSESIAGDVNYQDSWGRSGISIKQNDHNSLGLNFSVSRFSLVDRLINNENLKMLELPGTFLPNDEGMPNLPGLSRYVAVPNGAAIDMQITASRIDTFLNIDLAPAPDIPLDTDDGPLEYKKNAAQYSSDSFYPEQPILISDVKQMRGTDVVLLGITPFQYNPVTKTLLVYRDVQLQLNFSGGSARVGDEQLRSRFWDPILRDMIVNHSIIPEMNYSLASQNEGTESRADEAEYIIIVPDDPDFMAWADSLKLFRNQQGILTRVVTTTEIGGNSFNAIESFVDDAYYNWSTPPAAVLLLGDYGNSGNTITSSPEKPHPYSGTYVSDNDFADVDGDDLPDVVFSRITAQNAEQLQLMVGKVLDYERNPPTDPEFYDHPVTAMGWQTERWFQLCSEVVNGFWENKLGKNPVRENAIYSGTPGGDWSTADNTDTVVDYFGPSGLGYIPGNTGHLSDWGGNASRLNSDINSGAFMVQHRDHGSETGWGEPDYSSSDLSGLNNENLTFVFSVNCLTGMFNMSGECFTEAFHRHGQGALGLIAASQVSYSFVNDTYTWGMYDNMWPDFMPDYGTTPESRGIMPAFANAAGKYFLQQSDWPYNTSNKQITYYLFHHHGDAYSTIYSEVPQDLTINHNSILESGATSFTITADEGALIGLTINGTIIGVGEGTGSPTAISIVPQNPGDTMLVTVTKQNFYRYSARVPIGGSSGPYLSVNTFEVNDAATGNGNSLADYNESVLLDVSVTNFGSEAAGGVSAELSSDDQYLILSDSLHFYGDIDTNKTIEGIGAFAMNIKDGIPDQHSALCQVKFTDSSNSQWYSNVSLKLQAPVFDSGRLVIDDTATGNGNTIFDPGETVSFNIEAINKGHADAPGTVASLRSLTNGVQVVEDTDDLGIFAADDTSNAEFQLYADASMPIATTAYLEFTVNSGYYFNVDTFQVIVGEIPEFSMSEGTVTVTNAYFYDTGGKYDFYSDRERITMTFKGETGSEWLTAHFTLFDLYGDDELYIYDGPNRNAPQISGSPFSGTTLPPEIISTNNDVALTFYFESGLRFTSEGWEASISAQLTSDIDQPGSEKVTCFALHENYPNPFNPETTIGYDLTEKSRVQLVVYDVTGKEIRTLVNSLQSAGSHSFKWDGRNNHGQMTTSGVYFYKIKTAKNVSVKKMILIK